MEVEAVTSGEGAARQGVPSRTRARALRLAGVVISAALFAVAVSGALRYRRWRDRKLVLAALGDALRGYSECLLGQPLATEETAASRLRRIEAGLSEPPPGAARAAVGDGWPGRCNVELDHAHTIIAADPELAKMPAAHDLDALVVRARVDPAPVDSPSLIDDLFRAVAAVGATATARRYPPAGARLAPPPASPLVAAALPPLPVRAKSAPDELAGLDPLTLRLSFFDEAHATWTCAFTPLHGEPLREARCGEKTRGAVSVLTGDAARGPGYLRTVHGRFDRFELVRSIPGATDPDVTPLSTSMQTVALYGDQLVWVSWHRLYARTVTPGRAALGQTEDLGEIIGVSPELTACPTPSALIVGVKTFDETLEPRKSWRAMAAYEAGKWERTPGAYVADVGASFTCEGHAGTWTWFDKSAVSQVRCNQDRCDTQVSDPLTLSWDVGGPLYTADLGGRALVLGLGTTPGPLTGKSVASVRMRMAPLSAIPKAADVVLWSDQAHDGAALSDVTVYVRDGAALVLLKGEEALPYRAIRVNALGDFAPVPLAD